MSDEQMTIDASPAKPSRSKPKATALKGDATETVAATAPEADQATAPIAGPTEIASSGSRIVIGLPIQFHTDQGPVPGVVVRQSRTDDTWDLKILPFGAAIYVLRPGIRQSDVPMVGRFTLLPGFGG